MSKEFFWVRRYSQTIDDDGKVNICVYSTTRGNSSTNLYYSVPDSYQLKSYSDFVIPAVVYTDFNTDSELDNTPPFAASKKSKNVCDSI